MSNSNLSPYLPPQQIKGDFRSLRLDTNESAYPRKFTVLGNPALHRYPDPHAEQLCAAIAKQCRVDAENVLCGAGSTDVLSLIIRRFAGKGVAALDPSFGLYRACAAEKGVPYHGVPVDEHFRLDPDAVRQAPADLRLLCNPNNPTGAHEDPGMISAIAQDGDGVTVVDEAYVEFAEAAGHASCLPLVCDGADNLIVVRTCSKAHGLAAMRIGYAIAHRTLIRKLLEIRPPFALSWPQQDLGIRLFNNMRSTVPAEVKWVLRDRFLLEHRLAQMGCTALRSEANFLLFSLPAGVQAQAVHATLRDEHNVFVRIFPDHPRIGNMLRVTVGTPQENRTFVRALQCILSKQA